MGCSLRRMTLLFPRDQWFRFAGFWNSSMQQGVLASTLRHWFETGELLSLSQMQEVFGCEYLFVCCFLDRRFAPIQMSFSWIRLVLFLFFFSLFIWFRRSQFVLLILFVLRSKIFSSVFRIHQMSSHDTLATGLLSGIFFAQHSMNSFFFSLSASLSLFIFYLFVS